MLLHSHFARPRPPPRFVRRIPTHLQFLASLEESSFCLTLTDEFAEHGMHAQVFSVLKRDIVGVDNPAIASSFARIEHARHHRRL